MARHLLSPLEMRGTVASKLLETHQIDGELTIGQEVGLKVDQTLTQDATGTLVMLELEAMALEKRHTELSVQYVDHNLLQEDYKNPDDHLFLQSAAQRFGLWFSRPGNGVSHPLHMTYFGKPGATLVGSDSHTCAGGAIGMLAIGTGGLEVALAIAGFPFYTRTPKIIGVELSGELPPMVSAKDVILELLRRRGVRGASGAILEYHGPGVRTLDAWDRHVIANMGQELGATTTVFPSDERTRSFLEHNGRGDDWRELARDASAEFEEEERIDLGSVEPLIAKPSSPGNVVPVREVVGEPIYQAYIGSSANPGFRDFAIAAEIVRDQKVHAGVSLDINPSTRGVLMALSETSHLMALLDAGGRLHETGCNGCIGMGQAPASGRNSLRTVPRNFPGRSGTPEDAVWLCSPETAATAALHGEIRDPREQGDLRVRSWPSDSSTSDRRLLFLPPRRESEWGKVELLKGPNVDGLPELEPIPDEIDVPILLMVGDDISTDEILPAGADVLPLRSNIPAISEHCFRSVQPEYVDRTKQFEEGHAIVGGENYGQGSSREHAALAPRYLGLRVVLAKSFSRIHEQNLVNFGVLPLALPGDAPRMEEGDRIRIEGLREALESDGELEVRVADDGPFMVKPQLSSRQRRVLLRGGLVPWARERLERRDPLRSADTGARLG
jgi:aconitate hydratase